MTKHSADVFISPIAEKRNPILHARETADALSSPEKTPPRGTTMRNPFVSFMLFAAFVAAMPVAPGSRSSAGGPAKRRVINLPTRPVQAPFSDGVFVGDSLYLARPQDRQAAGGPREGNPPAARWKQRHPGAGRNDHGRPRICPGVLPRPVALRQVQRHLS